MDNKHFERGLLLMQHDRFQEAIGELTLDLSGGAEHPGTHAMLARCHLELEHFPEATAHAQQAIGIAPEAPLGHYMLAAVLTKRGHFPEAQRSIEEALRLDPEDANAFALLAGIFMAQQEWREALAAANQGLAINPEHSDCTNYRARAQVMLGDRAGAARTMGEAISRRPDDAYTHANQGWTLLHQGQHQQALVHFREALRIDPGMEWARAGIVEALKARNFLYRWLLAYFLWMARLPSRVQWGLVMGALVGQQVVASVAEQSPVLAPVLWPLVYLYFGFVVLTWLAYPLFNLLLRFDRFGRHALSRDQVNGANVLALYLLGALVFAAVAAYFEHPLFAFCTIMFVLLTLPASAIFRCDEGWPRWTMAAIALGLTAAVVAVAVGVPLLTDDSPLFVVVGLVALLRGLPWAMLGSQFAASYLASVTPRR